LEEALRNINIFLNRAEADTGKALLASAHKYRLIMLADLMRYDDLIRCSEESISKFPEFTDLYHLSAAGYQSLGKTGKAMELLRKALSMGPAEEGYPSVAGHGTFLTCRDLGILHNCIGNPKSADLYFTLASVMAGEARLRFKEPQVS
ncbi:hypothetical protein ACE3NQ_30580, partial [Paenibacillus terreus]